MNLKCEKITLQGYVGVTNTVILAKSEKIPLNFAA